jgi:hypothetical protein
MGPDVLVIATPISPSQSSINVATYVRIVAMSIAAYEYVAICDYLHLRACLTRIRPAISLPSHLNISYTSLLGESGKNRDACFRDKLLTRMHHSIALD